MALTDSKEEVKKLKGFIVDAGHKAQVFKNHLDRMEENVCRCGGTPSEVGKSSSLLRTKAGQSCPMPQLLERSMCPPPIKNSIPLPVPAPTTCCVGPSTTLPPMEEITEEPTFICEDLDGLLREADEGRARDLQEGSSQSVVRSPPRLGSERWRSVRKLDSLQLCFSLNFLFSYVSLTISLYVPLY